MILIDGQPAHGIDCADRGLQYGDGLFETIACRDGQPCWLALHLQRLRHGCERLRIAFQYFDALASEIRSLATGQQRCLVKVIVTRGSATRRGYAPAGDERPSRVVRRYPWPTVEPGSAAARRAAGGFRLGVSSVTLGINPLLAGLKHLNRLEQVLAQMARDPEAVDEVLMMSSAGLVIGGSMSNVFLADDSGLFTPALDDCGVAGVMRRRVLEAAASRGIALRVRAVAHGELAGVREVFVTNVRWGLQSARLLDGRALTSDAHAQQLRDILDAAHA